MIFIVMKADFFTYFFIHNRKLYRAQHSILNKEVLSIPVPQSDETKVFYSLCRHKKLFSSQTTITNWEVHNPT